MYMKLKDGKSKVLTFSYDDGVVQDLRLGEIFDKHGLKGTFNINSGIYCEEDKERDKHHGRLKKSELKRFFENSEHEVAVHAVTHPFLEKLSGEQIVAEVLMDRINIEKEIGHITRGMAYPFGTYNDEVVDCIAKCGICYARTTKTTEKFSFPDNWLTLHPTCHHKNPKLMELAKKFVETESRYANRGDNWLFYVWGHAYEFDDNDNWNIIEEFAEYVGGRNDIWYATNIEIYDYVQAYNRLVTSADGKTVYNPSCIDVWFCLDKITYKIAPGETLHIK